MAPLWRRQENQMFYIAHITSNSGITGSYALISMDRDDALREAWLLALALNPRGGFTYSVRAE